MSSEQEVKALMAAAERGDAEAQYALAMRYREGNGVGSNPKKMVKWCNAAAKQGHCRAQVMMAEAYVLGFGVDKNGALALKWATKAAEQGNVEAYHTLGNLYEKGIGVEKDEGKALEWVLKAAEGGYAEAQRQMSYFYMDGSHGLEVDEVRSFEWVQKAAAQGNISAQIREAGFYVEGYGVEKSVDEGIRRFRVLAEQGVEKAYLLLATAYMQNAIEGNEYSEQAVYWLKKAAEVGESDAMKLLSIAYYLGNGVEKDDKEAFRLAQKSVSEGDEASMGLLSMYYAKGIGVEPDLTRARMFADLALEKGADLKTLKSEIERRETEEKEQKKLCEEMGKEAFDKHCREEEIQELRAEAEAGDMEAVVELAMKYMDETDEAWNVAESVKWFRISAKDGDAWSQYCLFDQYECYGEESGISEEEALSWLRASAEQGHVNALSRLGRLYFVGDMVEQDYAKAYECFQQVDEDDLDELSMLCLAEMYFYGRGVAQDREKGIKLWKDLDLCGYSEASVQLGKCYLLGEGVRPSAREAEMYLRRAAEDHDPEGRVYLSLFYREGLGGKPNLQKAEKWLQKASEYESFDVAACLKNAEEVILEAKRILTEKEAR